MTANEQIPDMTERYTQDQMDEIKEELRYARRERDEVRAENDRVRSQADDIIVRMKEEIEQLECKISRMNRDPTPQSMTDDDRVLAVTHAGWWFRCRREGEKIWLEYHRVGKVALQ